MKKPALALLMIASVAACRGTPQDTVSAPSHASMVTALNGAYLWDCTVTNEAKTGQWQFVVAQQMRGAWPQAQVIVAGRDRAEDVPVKKDGAARIYTLRDTSEFLIADDGEVRGSGRNASKGDTFPIGQCTRGRQVDAS